ncbi:MAG TPA: YbfB/YjiJ family MFS transporter, partial [Desulfurivibrionaceae bacterium]|nr:YbfB/YjiJ family MFS transporter [Desulfurivibrionaceae bacterium]
SLLVSLATTVFMGATVSVFWWALMRLLGGVATAILFIVISAEVAGTLVRCGRSHWLGFLFAGVGLGIALSGLLVPVFDAISGWQGSWYGMGGLAVALAAVGLWLGRQRNLVQPDRAGKTVARVSLEKIYLLAAAYFFEGLGYIVTATFLVAMITVTPGLETLAPYSWVAVGCAAAPSTVAWPLLARRIGSRQALLLAYLVQGSGILVRIGADSVVAVLYAAVTFGGTFMGIVALTLAEGNRRMPAAGGLAAAFLTASFSVGQIFGPIIAGILADVRQGFDVPLLLATACIVLAGVAVALDRGFQRS